MRATSLCPSRVFFALLLAASSLSASAEAQGATPEPRRGERRLPERCDQDPFHVDYGALREGSLVRLGRHRAVDGDTNWDPSMEHYVDRVTPVVSARGLDPQGCAIVEVAIDSGEYIWRVRDLTLVAEAADTSAGAPPELRIVPGAIPDPRVFEATLGTLGRRASTLSPGCAGWIGARPNFTMLVESELEHLALMVRARVDTVLVVRKPSREFVCVDDADGRDPVLAGRIEAGRYEVYVGAYEPLAEATTVRVAISERTTVRTEALDALVASEVPMLGSNEAGTRTRLRAGRASSNRAQPSPRSRAGSPRAPSAPAPRGTEPSNRTR